MSISHKSSNTQVFRLMLYRWALHPELFSLESRRVHRQNEYEVETWLVSSGHVIRFYVAGHCLVETVLEGGDHLPEQGLVHALPCLGEKDYEMEPTRETSGLGYVTTIQTESLTDNLYQATYREMMDFAAETNAIHRAWHDEDGQPSLSVVDAQNYKDQYHVQSYHLLGSTGLVLRTQTIFEVPRD